MTATAGVSTMQQPTGVRLMDLEGIAPDEGMRRLRVRAVEQRASDLFIVCNEQHVAVQLRRLGIVEPLSILGVEQGRRYLAHVRAESGMDVTEHRRPQDGRWIHVLDERAPVDLRISVIPTLHGEDMTIRLLDREINLLGLERLGLAPQQLDSYRKLLERPGGMILLTGPTGTGKTTTLYATLTALNNGRRKIHTIEDPVEYAVDGLRQSQVNAAIELGAEELLRGILRQAPDAIMIGELRDAETAEAAVWAANSGVLVLTTVHASSSTAAAQSMRGFDIPLAFIGTSLRAAVSQRLLRTLCPACRVPIAGNGNAQSICDAMQGQGIEQHLNGHAATLYDPQGCEQCHFTGFAGRTGVYEIMLVSPRIRDLIIRNAPPRDLRAAAVEEGMMTLREAALLKVAQGKTTMEEVLRCIPANQTEED